MKNIRQKGNEELLLKNGDLIYKSIEVMFKRITDLYCYTIPKAITGLTAIDHEIVNHFFQLHFWNFETDLFECILNLQKWEENDIQKFHCDLKKYGRSTSAYREVLAAATSKPYVKRLLPKRPKIPRTQRVNTAFTCD